MKELITTKELMQLVKVSRQAIADWRKVGMPYKKLGTRVRFDYDEVITWLEERGKGNE